MKHTLFGLVMLVGLSSGSAATDLGITFIKDDHIFIADSSGTNLKQVDSDPRRKGMLRVDKNGKRFSYFVDPQNDEKGRLVVINSAGGEVAEVAIRPVTDPPTGGMNTLEDAQWTTDGKIRIFGSINPSKCEMFDLDFVTGTESNGQTGVCGTFISSPDGKHTAERGLFNHFVASEERVNTIGLDGTEDFYYGVDDKAFAILAGPMWSPDSLYISAIRKLLATGEGSVVIIDLKGTSTLIPLPETVLEHPAITWVGNYVIAGEGSDAVQIDSTTNQIGSVTSEIADKLAQRADARHQSAAKTSQIEHVVKRAGGREGIALQ